MVDGDSDQADVINALLMLEIKQIVEVGFRRSEGVGGVERVFLLPGDSDDFSRELVKGAHLIDHMDMAVPCASRQPGSRTRAHTHCMLLSPNIDFST